jgi:asparagine synthase (glutamine-hydrolysing)
MCGVIVHFHHNPTQQIHSLAHRGPDEQVTQRLGKCVMVFSRLCINDLSVNGSQPFIKNDRMLVCNGEIYNHQLFKFEHGSKGFDSDCECLISLIETMGIANACNAIRGVFAMVWTDGQNIMAARDPVGVRPLFYSRGSNGAISFASEIKGLGLQREDHVEIFPPGHFYDSRVDRFICYYPLYWKKPVVKVTDKNYLKNFLIEAVQIRTANTDRPVGFFLSGGLDSSLVVSIAKKHCHMVGPIKTFSIGHPDSPDLKAARVVAQYLNTDHHEIIFDFEKGLELIEEVVKSIESYDTTTIRASTPMWILSKWISENTDCRVLLSGEGSDELLGGYKYFQNAPDETAFQMETQNRVGLLHQFDVLRADRCTAAHGLEVRVPFLDRKFIEIVMSVPPELKMTIEEKKILRDAFEEGDYLPPEILRRTKDAFSDAVGYSWVDTIKKFTEKNITDEEFEHIKLQTQGHNIPQTKEEAWYRKLFWKHYGSHNDHVIGKMWRPKWTDVTDPSARKLKLN